jgi:hypothetical protein
VDYRFALLSEERKKTPEPPKPEFDFPKESTPYFEIPIEANYRDSYMVLMNIPGRPEWLTKLQNVEQHIPAVFVGSIHYCSFNNYQAIVSPIHMTITEDKITYAESCKVEEKDLSLVYEFIFSKMDEETCLFSCRFLNAGKAEIEQEERMLLTEGMQQMANSLKECCEKLEASFFH